MNLFDNKARLEIIDEVSIPQSLFEQLNDYDFLEDCRGIRQKCELWFKHFPAQHQSDLRGRFRSINNGHHGGAFFELFLHELLIRLECEVQVHPEMGGLKPDFLVCQPDQKQFYLEATSVGPHMGPFTLSANERDVIDKLNKLTSSHFEIIVSMTGKLTRTLHSKRITSGFQELLEVHDPDGVQSLVNKKGMYAAPSFMIEEGGWTLTGWLDPIPLEDRSSNRMGKLARIPIVHANNPIDAVLEAIKGKGKKYPNLDLPLVIAVNVLNPIYAPDADRELLCRLWPWWKHRTGDRLRANDIAAFWRFRIGDLFNMFRSDACLYVNPQRTTDKLLPHVRRWDWEWDLENGFKITDGINIAEMLDVTLK